MKLGELLGEKMEYFTPEDNKLMTEKYLKDKGGICGQSCLAVIEKTSIQNILDNWKEMGIEFKGYSKWRQLIEYLQKRGFIAKRIRVREVEPFKNNYFYILRIQWIGEGNKKDKPFYGWGHWTEASSYTHFIIVHEGKIFCNEDGWFDKNKLKDYLDDGNGVITSALEIYKEVQNGRTK